MNVVAIIQVRVGSRRLPGKALYPLDGTPVLQRQLRRVRQANSVDSVVVATTEQPPDDVIVSTAQREETAVFRGATDDVLQRIHHAAECHNADIVVRLTGDNPFVVPRLIEELTAAVKTPGTNYATTKFNRTFPVGVEADAMSRSILKKAEQNAETTNHREHIGQYFASVANDINWKNITANNVIQRSTLEQYPDITDLRLTMDWPSDYELLRSIYSGVEFTETLRLKDAIRYVFENNLQMVNDDVEQLVL